MRRHLRGLTLAFEALERDYLAQREKQPDGEQAAQQAREMVYQMGPREVKVIHE